MSLQPKPSPLFLDGTVIKSKLCSLRRTQKELGEQIGVASAARLSLICNGLLAVQPGLADRIAEALGFDTVDKIVSHASAATAYADDDDNGER